MSPHSALPTPKQPESNNVSADMDAKKWVFMDHQ